MACVLRHKLPCWAGKEDRTAGNAMYGDRPVTQSACKYFVTAAAGFVGTRLVRTLMERGHSVRALVHRTRPTAPPGFAWGEDDPFVKAAREVDCLSRSGPEGVSQGEGPFPSLELVRGDVTDRESLRRSMAGCTHVFHLAAYAKNWAADPKVFTQQNVEGTRNVFAVAREMGVQRAVWTSSIVTFGPTRPGEVGDEDMSRTTDRYFTEYEASKAMAEREVLALAAEGFPVVIVNPTRVYGPGHLTEGNALSRLIDDYDRGRVPVLLNRGVNVGNYVLVDDVVEGHLLAMEHGRVGQRYILGGENASLREFFRTIDRVSGRRHIQIPIMGLSPLLFAWFQKKRAEWFGVYPRITPGWVRTFLANWAFCSDKAQRELGYVPTPLEQGVRITYEWLLRLRAGKE